MLQAAKVRTSALIPFIPRQIIMLETQSITAAQEQDKKKRKEKEKKERKKNSSSETLEDVPAAPGTLELDWPNGGSSLHRGKRRESLLCAIDAYLESSGFSKTLAVFRSEAQLPTDGGKTSVLNLEDLFCKFLELRSSEDTSIDWLKMQDSGKVSIYRKDGCENTCDASEHIHSKKRKNRDGIDNGTKVEIHKPGQENGCYECIDTDARILNKPLNGSHKKSEQKEPNSLASDGCSGGTTGTFRDKSLKELKTSDDETDFKKLVSAEDSRVKTKDKKKKKEPVLDSLGEHHLKGCHGMENTDHENHLPKPHVNDKEERKKKHKIFDPSDDKTVCVDNLEFREMLEENVAELNAFTNNLSTPSADSIPKHKDEKKKKTKRSSDALVGNSEQLELEASHEVTNKKSLGCENNTDFKLLVSMTKDASIKNALENIDSKSKNKKKKRDKSSSESLHAVESDHLDGGTSHDGKEGYATGHKVEDVLGKSDSGKEKAKEKISKKRKRLSSEERASQAENVVETMDPGHAKMEGAEDNKEIATHQKPDKSLLDNEYLTIIKKRKMEKSNENSTKTVKASSSEQLNILTEHKENPGAGDSQKEREGHQLANGNLEKEKEGGTSSKAMKKENRSAEPTANAFRRVKVEEVKFVDERLQDNSYWAKGGAGNGYGAKAQEILGQVRGRDFRHEKTKKKRGSYRGGQIDFHSHSIKFNYSDEE